MRFVLLESSRLRTVVLVHTPDRPGTRGGHYYGTRAIVSDADPIKRRLEEAALPKNRSAAPTEEKKRQRAEKARETRKRNRESAELAKKRSDSVLLPPPLPLPLPLPVAAAVSSGPTYAELAATVAQLQAAAALHQQAPLPPVPELKPAPAVVPVLCGDCGKRLMSRGVMLCSLCHNSYHNKCATPVPCAAEKRGDRLWTCRRCRR